MLDFKKFTCIAIFSSSALLLGCGSTQNKQSSMVSYEDLTPEQKQQVDASRKRVMQSVLGSMGQLQNNQIAPTPVNNPIEIAQVSSRSRWH